MQPTCVSSMGLRRGTLSTNADWSGVAAQAVMRKPASQRRWMPSEGYWKSSSTHCMDSKGRHDVGSQQELCGNAVVLGALGVLKVQLHTLHGQQRQQRKEHA
jgi:hypothetical protein